MWDIKVAISSYSFKELIIAKRVPNSILARDSNLNLKQLEAGGMKREKKEEGVGKTRQTKLVRSETTFSF